MKQFLVFLFTFTILFKPVLAQTNWVKTGLSSYLITSVETTPWGIIAGESDTRLWLNPPPPNDVFLSKDLGQTWIPLGLTGRGIEDLKYYKGKIYAATYYVINNKLGLYVSDGPGTAWKQIGPMVSLTKIDRDSKTIYLGGVSHGLWISQDEGINWVQKIGDGWYGPEIKEIKSSEDATFVTTIDKAYASLDHGQTWQEVVQLNGKGIIHFCINGRVVFAGATGSGGLYRSLDLGKTWEKLNSFGNYTVGGLTYFNKRFYAGKVNSLTGYSTVFETSDLGSTWTDTKLNAYQTDFVYELTWAFSFPSHIFAVVVNNGLYKYQIPKVDIEKFPFLDIPWTSLGSNEFIDKITSYFDHEYPLLGYGYFPEPAANQNTTVNFLGLKESEPKMYYSSHNGTDYALVYGTEIKSPADGFATYYYCAACGNSIKIDHQNGYQTIYMHLQKDSLVTSSGPVFVRAGQVIGKVGMTGNTTGPHLHFEIIKNGLYPNGLVDPYGWMAGAIGDPWSLFSWTDSLGVHQGTKSVYLWKNDYPKTEKFVSGSGSIAFDNKSIKISESKNLGLSIVLQNYSQPIGLNNLGYAPNTSFLINSYDFLGNDLVSLSNPAEIKVTFDLTQIKNVIKETLKIYFWNAIEKIWSPLPTILDLINNTVTTQTDHFSQFAVLGEKEDLSPPETQLIISGSKEGNWFLEYPTVTFETTDLESSPTTTFYTTSGEEEWKFYSEPFTLRKDGVTNLQFRSQDENGNIEETQNVVVQVDTKNRFKKKLVISSAFFKINK